MRRTYTSFFRVFGRHMGTGPCWSRIQGHRRGLFSRRLRVQSWRKCEEEMECKVIVFDEDVVSDSIGRKYPVDKVNETLKVCDFCRLVCSSWWGGGRRLGYESMIIRVYCPYNVYIPCGNLSWVQCYLHTTTGDINDTQISYDGIHTGIHLNQRPPLHACTPARQVLWLYRTKYI